MSTHLGRNMYINNNRPVDFIIDMLYKHTCVQYMYTDQ